MVGAVNVPFTVIQDTFEQRREQLCRRWQVELYLASAADFEALASVVCSQVTVRVCSGTFGATAWMDISGQGPGITGTGQGVLSIDDMADSPYDAVLTAIGGRPSAYPDGSQRCGATFWECPV